MDYTGSIKNYVDEEIRLLKELDVTLVNELLKELVAAYEKEATVYVFGNGGSASTASHMANDFNKGISEYTDKKFRICCLNDNVPTVLAIANDIGYEDIFSFQLRNKVKPGDLVIGISGSGNSPNVINALTYAKEQGAKIIGWVGFDGGRVSKITDLTFHVPVGNMQLVEDMHLILNHLMMYVIMKEWGIKAHC
ncbi:MAG: SIS domain-containing protein [Lachnospiraceae bacterium]|nr:SIS domain-containing protein [Lachnospiraceae bacterium]